VTGFIEVIPRIVLPRSCFDVKPASLQRVFCSRDNVARLPTKEDNFIIQVLKKEIAAQGDLSKPLSRCGGKMMFT
jgi:hypothetical protein